MAMIEDDRDVTYEINEFIGVLTTHPTGWQKEINLVSWNGGPPKYDIRDWDPDHERMSRGVTLYEKEMRLMLDLLKKRRSPRNFGRKQETKEESVQKSADLPADEEEFDAPFISEEALAEEAHVMEAVAEEAN